MIVFTGGGAFASEFLKQYAGEILSFRNVSRSEFAKRLKKANVIVHNAVNTACPSIASCVADNFYPTKEILDLLYHVNKRALFVYLSSMSILKSENRYLDFKDMNPYAFSKFLSEMCCLRYPLENVYCVRFSTIFYKDCKKDGLSRLIYNAVKTNKITLYNNGRAIRDFIPINIAVKYVYKVMKKNSNEKSIFNITSAKARSFFQIAKYLKTKIPSLLIENSDIPTTSKVLSSFSDKDIRTIGKIDFSLETEIDDYIAKIQSDR